MEPDSCFEIPSKLTSGSIHVSLTSTAAPGSVIAKLREILSDEEQARAKRFYFERAPCSYIVCRAALRKLLSRYSGQAASKIRFKYGIQGKPSFESPTLPRDRFNVSHSGELALLAFSTDREVGVDIEFSRDVDYLALAQHSFAADERARVAALSGTHRADRFYEYWTSKEACIKADGRGLSVPLDAFSIVRGGRDPYWRDVAARESAGSRSATTRAAPRCA